MKGRTFLIKVLLVLYDHLPTRRSVAGLVPEQLVPGDQRDFTGRDFRTDHDKPSTMLGTGAKLASLV
jgi:hypothetical protein